MLLVNKAKIGSVVHKTLQHDKGYLILNNFYLTHSSRMEFPVLINWTSPFQFSGVMVGIFHFYSNFDENIL